MVLLSPDKYRKGTGDGSFSHYKNFLMYYKIQKGQYTKCDKKPFTMRVFCHIIIIQRVVTKTTVMEKSQQKCKVKVEGTAYFLIGGKKIAIEYYREFDTLSKLYKDVSQCTTKKHC